MVVKSVRGDLSTITDIIFSCGTVMDVGFFFHTTSFLTSVVSLTLHDTLLTTRGRRGFIVFFINDVLEC